MARTNNLSNFLTDVADSIRSKKGTTGRISASNFDTEIAGIQTGVDINGIIEQYKVASGGNVNAGDFVKFINEITELSNRTDTQLSDVNRTGLVISAILLNENKVFIAHSSGSSYDLYGMICTINGTTVTAGTDTQLSNLSYAGYSISATLLNEDKVFIAHSYLEYKYYLYGIVCEISESTIVVETDTQLSSLSYAGYSISAILLSENTIFIAHSYNSNYYLYGMIVKIDGWTIIPRTDTLLSSTARTGYAISKIILNRNTIFIAHSYDSNFYLYGIVSNLEFEKQCKTIKEDNEMINGIAKTNGTSGQNVQIYVPNI